MQYLYIDWIKPTKKRTYKEYMSKWRYRMKKRYVIMLLVTLLIGCTSDNASMKQNNTKHNLEGNGSFLLDDKNNDQLTHDPTTNTIIDSITILDEIIKDTYTLDEHQDYEIIHLDEALYLVGARDDYNNNLNYWFSLYNIKDNTSVRIDGIHQLIKNIYYNDDMIVFQCNGKNSVTSFNDFPFTYVFDIPINQLKKAETQIGFDEIIELLTVGGNINASIIESVEYESDRIIIDFGLHETSVLAGGAFAPQIQLLHDEGNQLNIDIQNTYFDHTLFDGLLESSIVEHIEFDAYEHIDDTQHQIVKILFNKKYEAYVCEFIYGDDGFMKLQIKLM